MQSISLKVALLLAASLVTAAPAVELETREYPTVATYTVQLTDVDPAYLRELENVVVRLDDPSLEPSKREALEARQGGNCNVQGFAVVSGEVTPFQGSVQNAAANFGRAVTLTGVLPGCQIGLIPQSACSQWSIIDTTGCATSRSVTFT